MAHLYYAYPYPGQQMALHMYRHCDKSYLLLIGLEINGPWEEISPFSYAHRWAIKLSLLPSHSLCCWYKIKVWWQVIEYKLSVYSDMWQGSRIQGLRVEGWKGRKSNQSCEVPVISREAKALKRNHPWHIGLLVEPFRRRKIHFNDFHEGTCVCNVTCRGARRGTSVSLNPTVSQEMVMNLQLAWS